MRAEMNSIPSTVIGAPKRCLNLCATVHAPRCSLSYKVQGQKVAILELVIELLNSYQEEIELFENSENGT